MCRVSVLTRELHNEMARVGCAVHWLGRKGREQHCFHEGGAVFAPCPDPDHKHRGKRQGFLNICLAGFSLPDRGKWQWDPCSSCCLADTVEMCLGNQGQSWWQRTGLDSCFCISTCGPQAQVTGRRRALWDKELAIPLDLVYSWSTPGLHLVYMLQLC